MLFRGAKWTTEKILDRLTTRRVRTLELYNTSAGDDLLLELAGTGSLTALDVSSAHITDVGVQVIVRQCKLKSLMFRDAVGVTDRSMVDISGCKTLRELYLEGTSVSDDGIGHIGRLPELWSLDISRTAVTDIGLERIASDRIRLISFNDSQITGRGFSSWSVPDKFSLYTRRSQLDDEGFAVACRSFPFLWNLAIEDVPLTNKGLFSLAGQQPPSMRINGSRIDRDGVLWIIENLPVQLLETDTRQFSQADAKLYENYQGRYLKILPWDHSETDQ
ncbi:leucine-rich repeat domain-containing protein [Planctopirus ephydatiae]|nr:hypothetical protein [Planctopirus ephydatiae]